MSNHIVEAAAISILLPSITKTNPVLAAHYQNRLSLLVDAHTQSLCARRLARGQDPAEALALMDLQNPAREEPLPEQLRASLDTSLPKSRTPAFESVEHLAIQVDGFIRGAVIKAVFTEHEIELTFMDGSSIKSKDFKFSVSPSK